MELIAIISFLLILAIPISAVIRLITAGWSPKVRQSIARHPIVHLIWLTAAITVVALTLLLPPLR
jgi:hypothetical protein